MKTQKENNGLLFPERPPRRQSYMLRCVESRALQSMQKGSGAVWFFSLQDPKNGKVINFEDLNALVAFLQSVFDAD
ncbi:MAG: hypothetical protein PWQ55_2724 [Chloroflexota bacterium]|nr:hypothetical protein [Chloroflexota bacterium]